MKKIVLSVVAVVSMLSAESLTEAFQNGTYSTKARVFYFDRSFDKDGVDDAQALTAGGILKYETGMYKGLKAGVAYYGSHRLGNIFSRDEGKGTSILGRSGEDLSFLGEAYLEYCLYCAGLSNTTVKVGRQQLSTPLIQNHDLRVLPSVYEAAVINTIFSVLDLSDENKNVLDIGANIGMISLAIAHRYPLSKIYAFEPRCKLSYKNARRRQ